MNVHSVECVEPTNIVAERALRQAVIYRKLSFGTQSASGSRFLERLLAISETCRLQNRNAYQFLIEAIRAKFNARPAPTLLQQDPAIAAAAAQVIAPSRERLSETLSAEQVVSGYKGLSKVERAFRSLKTTMLHLRPIYHWRDDRIRAHVFLCMLGPSGFLAGRDRKKRRVRLSPQDFRRHDAGVQVYIY